MLRLRLLELMDEDAAAFAPLSRVYALGKDSPGYADQLETATLNACKAPCEMIDCCCKLISILEDLRGKCSVLLLSDVGCAALAACCRKRGATFGQFLFTADSLANVHEYDARDFGMESHEKALLLGLDILRNYR